MPRKILGVIDSDSYAKWGASLLAHLGDEWTVELVTVESRLAASDAQLAFALAGTGFTTDAAPCASLAEIIDRLNRDGHDAVFVSTSGAVSEAVITEITQRVHPRPVIMTGLPGISTPPKYKGLFRRAQADLFVLHSHREIREHNELTRQRGVPHNFVLATLPFLDQHEAVPEWSGERDSIVFAAQPGVPHTLADRRAIVGWLVQTALAHPELRVVIKVRAQAGERQTHRERHPYVDLVPANAPANLVVEGGSMLSHLARAVGFLTVSSTAAIEAIAAGVPCLVLSDFGVSGELINTVFVGSGLLGSSRELIAARFRQVDPAWRADNYFHPAEDNDWQSQLEIMAGLRDAGLLPERPAKRRSRGGALRRAWDRKRAFGPYDRTAIGYLAALIGYPVLTARRAAAALRKPAPAAPYVDETGSGQGTRGDAAATAPVARG
ncbi:hypothetical protein GCM10022286_15880 [Gryllotalpicola daejeonensis]|uniref:Uncharacterized protein n=1 Tax=Gryllotalpicola daejeonensis TaxID=993087 RepID=A0ABP7ZJI4_9MICO